MRLSLSSRLHQSNESGCFSRQVRLGDASRCTHHSLLTLNRASCPAASRTIRRLGQHATRRSSNSLVVSPKLSVGRRAETSARATKLFAGLLRNRGTPPFRALAAILPPEAFLTRLSQAWESSRSGDLEAAKGLLDTLRREDLDLDQRAHLELVAAKIAHRSMTDPAAELAAIAEFAKPLRDSPRVLYALSHLDPSLPRQVACLEKILSSTPEGDPFHVVALERLISRYVNVRRQRESEALTRRCLIGGGRECKAAAAKAWAQIHPEAPAWLRLLLLCWSHALRPTTEALRAALPLAVDSGWKALSIYLGRQLKGYNNPSDGQFQLGRAYVQAGLPSLGYDSYARALDAGVSLARLNMATLVGSGAVPMAALKMMDTHSGDWNCLPPSFPFEFRARMTNAVSQEETRGDMLNAIGETQFCMFVEIAELTTPMPIGAPGMGKPHEPVILRPTEKPGIMAVENLVSNEGTPLTQLVEQPLLEGLYEARLSGGPKFGVARSSASLIHFAWFDVDGSAFPERCELPLTLLPPHGVGSVSDVESIPSGGTTQQHESARLQTKS